MFINDVNKKGEIRNIAIQHLRKYGIKYRDKNSRPTVQVGKSKRFFKVPLQNLEKEIVTLKNGQQLVIPKQLYDLCCFIFTKIKTEGLFRKEGSKSRQNEIKLLLDRGCLLGDDHHEIDVAVVLKCFLRELPEPLIPYSYHELFLRCTLIEKKVEAILLACLLLPSEHLNVLAFLMQFWYEVASYSQYNKMNSYNIAILLGPNIFPISEKIAPKNKLMVTRACNIIQLMIDNSKNIGLIPDYIIEQIGCVPTTEVDVVDKVKRRRSGSLTRLFNGLKKIVGNRADEEILSKTVTPDLLLTPSNDLKEESEENNKQHRRRELKHEEMLKRRGSTKTGLERRWSAITQVTNFKKRKTNSLIDLSNNEMTKIARENYKSTSNAEYVQVSKTEYEEIKNRVSAIEKRLSIELENVQSTIIRENTNKKLNIIQNIQSVYEQTLVQSEPLNSGTDLLAKRLGKELRIRNSEEKMIRSPSARKIGNMRRRSRELDKPNSKSSENPPLHFLNFKPTHSDIIRRASSPAQCSFQKTNIKKKIVEEKIKRTASFHGRYKSTHISCNSSMRVCVNSCDTSTKTNASDILSNFNSIHDNESKSSKVTNQDIGIFQNNAILFDNKHSDVSYLNTTSAENLTTNVIFSSKFEHKIGSLRKPENRGLHKIRTLKAKENRMMTQNISPINKSANLKQKERNHEILFIEMKRLEQSDKENGLIIQDNILNTPTNGTHLIDSCTPKIVPHIKKQICIKSPKRVRSVSQNSCRNTPLKVLSSSTYFSPNV